MVVIFLIKGLFQLNSKYVIECCHRYLVAVVPITTIVANREIYSFSMKKILIVKKINKSTNKITTNRVSKPYNIVNTEAVIVQRSYSNKEELIKIAST